MLATEIDSLKRRLEKLKQKRPAPSSFPSRELELRGANLEIQKSRYKQLLLAGAAGTGKSLACLWKIYNLCMNTPQIRILFVRKTLSSMRKSVLVSWEDEILGYGHPVLRGGAKRANRQTYDFPNGAQVVLGGMDKADAVLSSSYDVIYVCQAEELLEDDIDALISRLRNYKLSYQQLLMDCNPQSKSHWLYQRHMDGKLKMLTSFHRDNPFYWNEKEGKWTPEGENYLEGLRGMGGIRYRRLFLGEWCAAEGAVFPNFDRDRHSTKEMPRMKRYVCGVDWGHSDAGAMVLVGEGIDGKLYVVEELLHTGKTLDFWEQVAHRFVSQYRCELFVCDPSNGAYIQAFKLHGLPAVPAFNKIPIGIDLIHQRLNRDGIKIYAYSSADVDENLRQKHKPLTLVEEIEACVWNETKDLPKSGDDHALDAFRYAVVQYDRPRTDIPPVTTQSASLYSNSRRYSPNRLGFTKGRFPPRPH